MFDIGIGELAMIGLLALIVLGPKRLPEVARTAGLWVGRARRFVASVKEDFDQELRTEELTELRKLQHEISETRQFIQQSSSQTLDALQHNLETQPSVKAAEKQPKRKASGRAQTVKRKKSITPTARSRKTVAGKKDGGTRKRQRS